MCGRLAEAPGSGHLLMLLRSLSPASPGLQLLLRVLAAWPTWAATARPYFTFVPARPPSAFREGKFRHLSELSKKFQFHVCSRRGGTPTDLAQMTTFRGWVRPTRPPLSSKAVVPGPRLRGSPGGSCDFPGNPVFFQIRPFRPSFGTWS